MLLICLIIPVANWLLLKPVIQKAQQARILNQLKRIQIQPRVVCCFVKEQAQYTLPADEWSIVLGNANARTVITMVSNPYCPPCVKPHQELDTWLDKLNEIQLRIVLLHTTRTMMKTPVTRRLMAMNETIR